MRRSDAALGLVLAAACGALVHAQVLNTGGGGYSDAQARSAICGQGVLNADCSLNTAALNTAIAAAPAITSLPTPVTSLTVTGNRIVGNLANGGTSDPGNIPVAGDAIGNSGATVVPMQKPAYAASQVLANGGTTTLPANTCAGNTTTCAWFPLTGSGIIAAATVVLPASPVDKQTARFAITNTGVTVTLLTVKDAAGNTVGTLSGLLSYVSAVYQYQGTAWVRMGS